MLPLQSTVSTDGSPSSRISAHAVTPDQEVLSFQNTETSEWRVNISSAWQTRSSPDPRWANTRCWMCGYQDGKTNSVAQKRILHYIWHFRRFLTAYYIKVICTYCNVMHVLQKQLTFVVCFSFMMILDKSTTHIGIVALTAGGGNGSDNYNLSSNKIINRSFPAQIMFVIETLITTLRSAKPLSVKPERVCWVWSHSYYQVPLDEGHMFYLKKKPQICSKYMTFDYLQVTDILV